MDEDINQMEVGDLRRALYTHRERDAHFRAITFASKILFRSPDWRKVGKQVFKVVGDTFGFSRIYLYERVAQTDGKDSFSKVMDWEAAESYSSIEAVCIKEFLNDNERSAGWRSTLSKGKLVQGQTQQFAEQEQEALETQETLAIVMIPLFVGDRWWGVLVLDDCFVARSWSGLELEGIAMLGKIMSSRLPDESMEQRSEGDSTEGKRPRFKLLLAEDSIVNQKTAVKLLAGEGVDVDVAADGQEAIDMLMEQDYDLVVLDCVMPVLDGFDTSRIIRQIENYKRHTPIVALTGLLSEQTRYLCVESGMDEVLQKPLSMTQMKDVFKRYIPAFG